MAQTTSHLHARLDPLESTMGGRAATLSGAAPATLYERRRWIAEFRTRVARHRDALVSSIAAEIGKSETEALLSDVVPLLDACRWHERHFRRVLRPRRLDRGSLWQLGQRQVVRREPIGRVAIIATWNYPVQLLGIQLVQALAAGNAVVVKPSERSPQTQVALLEHAHAAIVAAGADPRLLTWTEPTREAGQALLLAERFDHIVFTGSTGVGREIAEIAAPSLTPTTLELSGCDSAFVLADADPRLAARTLWSAVVMNAGQTCMAPRRVLVEDAVYNAFLAELTPLAASAPTVRVIDPAAATLVHALAEAAIAAGGRPLASVLEAPRGARLRPVAVADCPRDAALVAGEHFGPAIAIVRVRDLADALHLHHRVGQHLSASVFTRDARRGRALAPLIGVTSLSVNDAVRPTAHPAASLGGRGESGWGVSRGREGLLAMTRPVFVSSTSRWIRLPAALPTGAALRGIDRLVSLFYGGRA